MINCNIECDNCGATDDHRAKGEEQIRSDAEGFGWLCDDDGDYCPKCRQQKQDDDDDEDDDDDDDDDGPRARSLPGQASARGYLARRTWGESDERCEERRQMGITS